MKSVSFLAMVLVSALGCDDEGSSGGSDVGDTADVSSGDADIPVGDVGGGGVTCDFQAACAKTGGLICTDYGNYESSELDALQADCTAGGDSWSTSPCTHTGAVGGCRVVNAISRACDTGWAYGGVAPAATLESVCTSGGGVWVAP